MTTTKSDDVAASRRDDAAMAEIESRGTLGRYAGYFRRLGPGYLQSAMTLGGGSAFAALFSGAAFGYDLLWVAPLAMLLGIIVLAAVAWTTLSTGENPYRSLAERVHPIFAWAFAVGGLVSSIVWQFAQYALASAMLVLLAARIGFDAPQWVMGVVALAWCAGVTLLYGRSSVLVRRYELILTSIVWFIVVAFAVIVVKTGVPSIGAIARGYVPNIPPDFTGIDGDGKPTSLAARTLIVSGLAAAVGANMIFVYPYTLRKKGWGRAHRRLAIFDLVVAMFIPFSIAASLMIIASAAVFHFGSPELFTGSKISPAQAAVVFAAPDRLGEVVGLWVFGLGIIAMALSSITVQMLAAGFACEQMFGWKDGTRMHRVGQFLPAIGVLGAVFWTTMSLYVPIPVNIICGTMLPLVYIGFTILLFRRSFLGDDTPRGAKAIAWGAGLGLATLVLTGFLLLDVIPKIPAFFDRLLPG